MNRFKLQTVERASIFTRLDFRSKLAMMLSISLVSFCWENPLLNASLAVLITLAGLFAGVRARYLYRLLAIMTPFYLIMLATHGFFNVFPALNALSRTHLTYLLNLPDGWVILGSRGLSLEGLWYGIGVIFKTLCMTLVLPVGIFTTEVDHMIVSLVKARVPYRLTFIFSSTLRFFPLLIEESRAILQAQRLRGLALEDLGLRQRVSMYARVIIPLALGAMIKAQQLEVVLQSKAFSGSSQRTYLHDTSLKTADWVVISIAALFPLAALTLYLTLGIGRFAMPFGW